MQYLCTYALICHYISMPNSFQLIWTYGRSESVYVLSAFSFGFTLNLDTKPCGSTFCNRYSSSLCVAVLDAFDCYSS